MDIEFAKHNNGVDKGDIMLFTLSTCGWCFKTKTLLKELGVAYSYVDMDMLDDEQAGKAMEIVKKYTSRTAYPTVIINEKECIIGYDPERLNELFGN